MISINKKADNKSAKETSSSNDDTTTLENIRFDFSNCKFVPIYKLAKEKKVARASKL